MSPMSEVVVAARVSTEEEETEVVVAEALGAEDAGTEAVVAEALGTEDVGTDVVVTEEVGTEALATVVAVPVADPEVDEPDAVEVLGCPIPMAEFSVIDPPTTSEASRIREWCA